MDFDTFLQSLTEQQREVVMQSGQGQSVVAGAGCGKTTTLVAKCLAHVLARPSARFAAVSFTEKSAYDLKERLSLVFNRFQVELDGHWIMTIHGLCGAIVREFPHFAECDGEEEILDATQSEQLWQKAVQALWDSSDTDELQKDFDYFLDREGIDGFHNLLKRVRELDAFGIQEHLEKLSESNLAVLRLQRLSQWTQLRYQKLKRDAGFLDFADLEKKAQKALEHAFVRNALQKRFDLILVDEFQDTNPVQCRIIEQIALPQLSNLCIVGDPKQSIYRFRDADLSVYEQFCRRMPLQQQLNGNFRSRREILDLVNQTCAPLFEASQLHYDSLVACRKVSDISAAPVIWLTVQHPREFAFWLQLQKQEGAAYADFALLLRRIRGNEHWLFALRSAGIPFRVESGGLFWKDPRVVELVAFLRAWQDPSRTFSMVTFLRSPWVSVPDERIHRWIQDQSRVSVLESFLDWKNPVAEVLRPLYKQRGQVRPGELLLKLLQVPLVENDLAIALIGLWNRVEEWSLQGSSFAVINEELQRKIDEEEREREIPVPDDWDCLKILTLHSSKGLEFKKVILVDFEGPRRSAASPLLYWDRKKGLYLAQRDLVSGERLTKDLVEGEWKKEEQAKALEESKRLFYVALTRARDQLVLVIPEVEKIPVLDPGKAWLSDNWSQWLRSGYNGDFTDFHAAPKTGFSSIPVASGAQIEKNSPSSHLNSIIPIKFKRARHSVTEWLQAERCLRAYQWKFLTPKNIEVGGESEKLVVASAELGTQLHAALRTEDPNSLDAYRLDPCWQKVPIDLIQAWWKKSSWMQPTDSSSGREVWRELPFEIPLEGGEVLAGIIDRVVVVGTEAWLLDFKWVDTPLDPAKVRRKYRDQLEYYAYALSRLGLPLVKLSVGVVLLSPQGVVEVPIPLDLRNIPEKIAQLLRRIDPVIQGDEAAPRPGKYCDYCLFLTICPESQLDKLNDFSDDELA